MLRPLQTLTSKPGEVNHCTQEVNSQRCVFPRLILNMHPSRKLRRGGMRTVLKRHIEWSSRGWSFKPTIQHPFAVSQLECIKCFSVKVEALMQIQCSSLGYSLWCKSQWSNSSVKKNRCALCTNGSHNFVPLLRFGWLFFGSDFRKMWSDWPQPIGKEEV